jgi:hypothetical protein
MAMQIKSIKGVFSGDTTLYTVPANKAAIVKVIRVVNHSGNAVTLTLKLERTGTGGCDCGISQVNYSIANNMIYVDDKEVTMEYLDASRYDRIHGTAASNVDWVLSVIERDL